MSNQWELLKANFDALAHDETESAASIDEIFDIQFRRRFAELINLTARHNTKADYFDWSHDTTTPTVDPDLTLRRPDEIE